MRTPWYSVTVMRPWGCTLHYVGAKPYGADERRQVSLAPGQKFVKYPSTLTLTGPEGQDVALIRNDGGTVLLLGKDFLDLVHRGVLFDQGPCDPQEHDTEAEYLRCPDCFPPFRDGPPEHLWSYTFACGDTLVTDDETPYCPTHGSDRACATASREILRPPSR